MNPPWGQSWNVHGSGTPVPFGLVPPLHRPKADLPKLLSLAGCFICLLIEKACAVYNVHQRLELVDGRG